MNRSLQKTRVATVMDVTKSAPPPYLFDGLDQLLTKLGCRTYVNLPDSILRLFVEQRIPVLLGFFAFVILLLSAWPAFYYTGFAMGHDEAEHLSALFSLERGEVPYRDFLENHPLLFHIALGSLKNLFQLSSGVEAYWLGKSLVFAHFALCILILVWLSARVFRRENRPTKVWALAAIALVMPDWWLRSLWTIMIWELRPDWICYAYALLAIVIHYDWHARSIEERDPRLRNGPMLIAGAAAGLSTAILFKSIYLFLPYALSLAFITIDRYRYIAYRLRHRWRQVLIANFFFLVSGFFFLSIFVFFELKATGATFAEYWAANVSLNSIKHILDSPVLTNDLSPFNVAKEMLGIGIIIFIVILIGSSLRLAILARIKLSHEYFLLYFIILTVVLNLSLPAFSNGLSWPHYLIPTVIVTILFFIIILQRLFEFFSLSGPAAKRMLVVRLLVLLLPFSLILAVFSIRFTTAIILNDNLSAPSLISGRVATTALATHFVTESDLPKNATYLSFTARVKPVEAKAWGYYYMLYSDKGLWLDNYRLGLGPDPRTYWATLFKSTPPDIIDLKGHYDFTAKEIVVGRSQGVDIGWLWPIVTTDYICLSKQSLLEDIMRLYVREKWVGELKAKGWTACGPEKIPMLKTENRA